MNITPLVKRACLTLSEVPITSFATEEIDCASSKNVGRIKTVGSALDLREIPGDAIHLLSRRVGTTAIRCFSSGLLVGRRPFSVEIAIAIT